MPAASSLALFGESDRAKEWMQRALLLDPDNLSMRYNLACMQITNLKDNESALAMLKPFFEQVTSPAHIRHLEVDPERRVLRLEPRAAKQRLGIAG